MWNVARIGLIPAALALACTSATQKLSEEEAVRLAIEHARLLGHTPQGKGDAKFVERYPLGGRATPRWEVNFGDSLTRLESSGLLSSFRWMGQLDPATLPPATPPMTDEEAWEVAEAVLAPLGVPAELYRTRIRREPAARAATVDLFFNARAHGYSAQGGNSASVSIRNRDRTIIAVSISRGWNYEPPNIQISESQAIAIAANETKSSVDGWKTRLTFWTAGRPEAPEAIRKLNAQRTFRLCYDVWSERGNVTIDSVTGDVVFAGRPMSIGEPGQPSESQAGPVTKTLSVPSKVYTHPKYKPIPPESTSFETPTPAETPRPTSASEAGGTSLPVIVGVAVVTGLVGFALARWRR